MKIYGIDFAMEKFDVNFLDLDGREKHLIVANKIGSITKFLEKIPKDSLLCAEHTGVYGNLLVFLCNQLSIPISLSSGYSIKHSLGLLKGKSDKLDARRIREYGERFADKLKLSKCDCENLQELNELYLLRNQLVKERKMISTQQLGKKYNPYNSISVQRIAIKLISTLNESISEIEIEILNIIESDKELKKSFELSTSVKGVGPITTCDLIIKTGNFKRIDTARKASSYAGTCPFPNSTGKMVKKDKVSHMSDKALKTLLHLCSKSAVQHNKEYKLYYQKKKQEGKPHYLILNNISNKLLRTIYSVVANGIPYSQNYICSDPRNNEKKLVS
jgi:transposase